MDPHSVVQHLSHILSQTAPCLGKFQYSHSHTGIRWFPLSSQSHHCEEKLKMSNSDEYHFCGELQLKDRHDRELIFDFSNAETERHRYRMSLPNELNVTFTSGKTEIVGLLTTCLCSMIWMKTCSMQPRLDLQSVWFWCSHLFACVKQPAENVVLVIWYNCRSLGICIHVQTDQNNFVNFCFNTSPTSLKRD